MSLISFFYCGRKKHDLAILTSFSLLLIFYVSLLPHVPEHVSLRSTSVLDLLTVSLKAMSWPFIENFWPSFIINIPIVILFWSFIRKKHTDIELFRILGCIFIGTCFMAGAIAYMRNTIDSRYTDLLSVNCVLNLCVILYYFNNHGYKAFVSKRTFKIISSFWCFLIFIGLTFSLSSSIDQIGSWEADGIRQFTNVRNYLSNGEPQSLFNQPYHHIPFPDPRQLQEWLDDPIIKRMLPIELSPHGRSGNLAWLRDSLVQNGIIFPFIGLFLLLIVPIAFHAPRQGEKLSGT